MNAMIASTVLVGTMGGCADEPPYDGPSTETTRLPSVGGPTAPPPLSAPESRLPAGSAQNPRLERGQVSVPWRSGGVDGRHVAVEYRDAGCLELDEHLVEETNDAVIIAIALERVVSADTVCNTAIVWRRATIRLRRPLGDRVLVHAAVSRGQHR